MSTSRSATDPTAVRAARSRDLLQTVVLVLVALTPAWLLPAGLALPWLGIVLVAGAPAVWFTWTGAPWVPTPTGDLDRVVALLDVGPGDRVIDLGAGDGRVLRHVAARTGALATGIEAAPGPWLLGRLRAGRAPRVYLGSRYGPKADRLGLEQASAVYLWSTPYGLAHPELRGVLERLPDGARVVCYGSPLPFWAPEQVDEDGQRPLYRYLVSSVRQPTT